MAITQPKKTGPNRVNPPNPANNPKKIKLPEARTIEIIQPIKINPIERLITQIAGAFR
jgi:hypothetical protein